MRKIKQISAVPIQNATGSNVLFYAIGDDDSLWQCSNNLTENGYRICWDEIDQVPQQEQPHKMLTPKVYRDGNKWCALYGENLQEGICGFGDTPTQAVKAFEQAWINAFGGGDHWKALERVTRSSDSFSKAAHAYIAALESQVSELKKRLASLEELK